jgi:predicted nucleic acid-binding protein
MTRYAIDSGTALRILREEIVIADEHQLVGPAVLRSHAMSALYRDVRAGALAPDDGRRMLERVATLKIRLLGDRVSRATAWRIATEEGWDDTAQAEYLAVAVLQADALVTDDPKLAAAAAGRIPLVAVEALSVPEAPSGRLDA